MRENRKTWRFSLSLIFLVVWTGAWANTLRVVTDNNYPPYVFQGQSGQIEGYVVDIWKLWEKKTGVKVEFTAMQWSEAQRTLLDGGADVIDMIFRTPVREKLYDYSPSYAKLSDDLYAESRSRKARAPRQPPVVRAGAKLDEPCLAISDILLGAFGDYAAKAKLHENPVTVETGRFERIRSKYKLVTEYLPLGRTRTWTVRKPFVPW